MSTSRGNSSNSQKLEWKYLLTLLLPLSCFIGLHFRGIWSPGSLYLGFVVVPFLDRYFFRSETFRPRPHAPSWFTRLILYLNLPVLLALSWYYYHIITTLPINGLEWFFLTLNLGIIYGSNGINVAHELGHRPSLFDRGIAFSLLLPSYYVHFTDAHNLGHHVKVGRPDDPASAGRGQGFYHFLPEVFTGEWRDFISINRKRMRRTERARAIWQNKIMWFILADIAWGVTIGMIWGVVALLSSFGLALTGITLLALINYIEHYGLIRNRKGSRYERVAEHHAWDSSHYFGRTLLYQLPLHADHHMDARKEYPELTHRPESPELPFGYPESMIRALIPPLWKSSIHPVLDRWEERHIDREKE